MKKLLGLVLVVVLASILVMPYVIGRIAESATHQLVDQINVNSLEYGEVDIVSYERGIRTTSSRIKWAPPGVMKFSLSEPIELSCNGNHGLISFDYQCKAMNVQPYTDFVANYLDGNDPLRLGGAVSVFGTITQSLTIEPFEMVDENGDSLNLKAGKIEVAMDQQLEVFDVRGQIGGLVAKGEHADLEIESIQIRGNLSRNQHNLLIGDLGLSMASMNLQSEQQPDIKVNGLKMNSTTHEQEQNMGVIYNLTINEFERSTNGTQPDQLNLENIDARFRLGGLDMLQVSMLSETLKSLSQKSAEDRNAGLISMLPSFEGLFKSGLNIGGEFSADYNQQIVEAEAALSLVGNLLFGDFLLLGVNPRGFFAKLKAGLKADLPQAMLDANPQSRVAIEGNPLYSKTAQGYSARIQLQDNEVSLNGKSMSIEDFLSLLSAAAP